MDYDRYAGIKSLPGPDGKMPRPFRVDESGNVIYRDDELDAVMSLGKDDSIRLAEASNPAWNGYEAMRAQGQRDGRAVQDFVDDYRKGEGQGAAVGGTTRVARVLDKNARVRENYIADVAKLDGFDNAGRAALKEHWRGPTPAEFRAPLKKVRSGTGPREGSIGRANVTNPKVNQAVRTAGKVGRSLGLAGAGLAIADVATANDPWRAGAANVGAVIGGGLGGAGGAALGSFAGPGAFVASPTLGAAGAVGGGHIGYELGEDVYDILRRYLR